MKKFIFLTLFCLVSGDLFAQNYVIESVTLTETISNSGESNVPRLVDKNNAESPIAAKINAALQVKLNFDSYNQADLESFRWYDLSFESEIKSGYLHIAYTGEYAGAGINYVSQKLFFDLKTGELVKNRDLPFYAFFTLDKYFSFLNDYWLPTAGVAFEEAIQCAEGGEPYCSIYAIRTGSLADGTLTIMPSDDCFPRLVMECAPEFEANISENELIKHLSDFGKKALLDDGYLALTGIDKFVYNQNATPPDYQFIFGKIAGRYAISMALETTLQDGGVSAVRGFYYYDSKKIPLTLAGTRTSEKINLTEMVDGRSTGEFTFTFHNGYQENAFRSSYLDKYITATWNTPNKTKTLPIVITEMQSNR